MTQQTEQKQSSTINSAKIITMDKQALLQYNLQQINTNPNNYYNADKDKLDIQQYYTGINFNEVDKQALFQALHELLESTHRNRINYDHSDEKLKTWVDLHPDKTFRSLYSRKEADPAVVIEQDMQVVLGASVDSLNGDMMNIEHVVPQSWFSGRNQHSHQKEPMRGDLHHLFYCEKDCNAFRGNKAYHDFAEYNPEGVRTEKVRSECGMTGGDGGTFEPEYGKGFVARATLYFLLRYPDKIEEEFRPKIDIEVLLNWNKQFPPTSVYEKHRNQAIFEIQGNRNPLIDYPELAERIDFFQFQKLH